MVKSMVSPPGESDCKKEFQSLRKSWLLNGTAEVTPSDGSRVHNRAEEPRFSANPTHTINKDTWLGGQEIIYDCF
jgi:hypothetical protein